MQPTTVELLRDILPETESLSTHAAQTTVEAFLHDEVLKVAHLAAKLRPILEAGGQS